MSHLATILKKFLFWGSVLAAGGVVWRLATGAKTEEVTDMSTTFRTADAGEWVTTRWAKRSVLDDGRQAFDFGSQEWLEQLEQLALVTDVDLVGENGERCTLRELLWSTEASATNDRLTEATFGEFGGTVELGSGELLRRLGVDL